MLRMALTPLTTSPHPYGSFLGASARDLPDIAFLLASHSSCCYFLAVLLMRKQLSKINGFKLYLYVARIQNKLQNRNTFPWQKNQSHWCYCSLSLPPPPPPSPVPIPPSTEGFLCSCICRLCVDFLQVSCSGDSFYLKGQFFQRGTKQNWI